MNLRVTTLSVVMCGILFPAVMLLSGSQKPNTVETNEPHNHMLGPGNAVWSHTRLNTLEGHVKAPVSPTRFDVPAAQLYDATYQFIQSCGVIRFSDDKHMEISGIFFDADNPEGQEDGYEFNVWVRPAKNNGESVLTVIVLDKPTGLQATNMPVTAYSAMQPSAVGLGVPDMILGVEAQLEGETESK